MEEEQDGTDNQHGGGARLWNAIERQGQQAVQLCEGPWEWGEWITKNDRERIASRSRRKYSGAKAVLNRTFIYEPAEVSQTLTVKVADCPPRTPGTRTGASG